MHTTSVEVGDVRITRVVDEEVILPLDDPLPAWCVPAFAASPTEVRLAFSTLAVTAEDGTRIVIDPWLANDAARHRPDAAGHCDRLVSALADAGYPADGIDLVVLTHFDGIGWTTRPAPGGGWVPTFGRARVLVPRVELDLWAAGGRPGHEEFAVAVDAGVVEPIDPPHPLGPGVGLVPLPGHSPGHSGVRVSSGGDLAVYVGHLVVFLTQIVDSGVANDDDPATAARTRAAVFGEVADAGGLLLTTLLGGPGGGRLRRGGAPTAWELTV